MPTWEPLDHGDTILKVGEVSRGHAFAQRLALTWRSWEMNATCYQVCFLFKIFVIGERRPVSSIQSHPEQHDYVSSLGSGCLMRSLMEMRLQHVLLSE
jgi:hypothetical protein